MTLVAVLLLLSGCGRSAPTVEEAAEQKPKIARSQVERGPVRLSVTVEPAPARLSDEPKLTLEIAYPPGITVHKPEFGTALGEFIKRDFREPLPRVEGQRQILQQVYTLEPTRAGKITIDPIAITFTDDRVGGEHKEHTLESEPITVEVVATVAEAPSLDRLHGPADPLPLPQPPTSVSWWLGLFAGGVLAAAGAGWWLWRRRKLQQAAPPLTPTELAERELQRLLESGLAQSDVKLFYVELTAIVRRYIERTTGIHAPEQTTQEFLHEIGRRADFPAEKSRRLMSFLEAADLVKFAAHQPRQEDVEESLHRARIFVGSAREEVAA